MALRHADHTRILAQDAVGQALLGQEAHQRRHAAVEELRAAFVDQPVLQHDRLYPPADVALRLRHHNAGTAPRQVARGG